MRIGIDFDNTIVSYDQLFYALAIEAGCPVGKITPSKRTVRDYFRSVGKEDIWTELQGIAYGSRIVEAEPFPGVREFFARSRELGFELFIVSHKTKYPFRGELYDLHKAALAWLEHHGFFDDRRLERKNVYLELTKEEKIERIATLSCHCFIDDLPEIFEVPSFPISVVKVLFDPNQENLLVDGVRFLQNWNHIDQVLAALSV